MKFLRITLTALALTGFGAASIAQPDADGEAPAPFDPPAARAFMDSVSASIIGGSPPTHWAENGSHLDALLDQGWIAFDTETGERSVVMSAQAITEALTAAGASNADGWRDSARFLDGAVDVRLDETSYSVTPDGAVVVGEAERPRMVRSMFPMNGYDRYEQPSPDGSLFASLDGPEIAVRRRGDAEPTALSYDADPLAPWFFGADIWEVAGDVWAPDGSPRFVARTHDMRGVEPIDWIDYLDPDGETHHQFRYWARAGDPLPVTTLYVVNAETGGLTPLEPRGDDQSFVFFLGWSEDGEHIAVMRYSRDAHRQEVFAVHSETGSAELLLSRAVERGWVKWPGGRRTFHWLEDGGFLFFSDEDGFFQIYRHGAYGERRAQLTSGRYDIREIAHIDEQGGWVYVTAGPDPQRPFDTVPMRIPLEGGPPERLSNLDGVHRVDMAPDGSAFISRSSSAARPPSTVLHAADGSVLAVIDEARIAPGWRADWPEPEEVTVLAADGETEMHGLILKPVDFDPARRYPVVHRVYDGMQGSPVVRGYFGASGSDYTTMLAWLAMNDMVVVMLDPPGSPGRGRDYNLRPWGVWPQGLIADHRAGLEALAAERPWMDLERLGVDGNSWGGPTVLSALIEAPDFYRAGAASVPEVDMRDGAHWIEWQLGSPQDNPEAYEAGRLHERAGEIEGDLLLIAGMADVNVPVSNTMKMLDALADANHPYELVLFPGTNHAHFGRGERYAYAVERIRHFFSRHLGGAEPADEP